MEVAVRRRQSGLEVRNVVGTAKRNLLRGLGPIPDTSSWTETESLNADQSSV